MSGRKKGTVTLADAGIDVKALREHLLMTLPEHMVPATFVRLEALPRTPNGKIDRRALPAPDVPSEREGQFVAPQTPTEVGVAAIWGEVLGARHVGVRDNFFELGGHSILAMLIVSRLRAHFGIELTLSSLFESPTVCELAKQIDTLVSLRELGPPVGDMPDEEVEKGTV